MSELPVALTLAESRERTRLLVVSGYVVDLDLTRGSEVFGSRTIVRFSCSSVDATSFVELRPARLVRAMLNGRPLEGGQLTANRLMLQGLQADNELVVEADMPYSSTGEGMHRFVDPLDGETYVGAYLGVDNAQRVFANFDQPDLKAPITASIKAPPGWTVVSNSLRRAEASNGPPQAVTMQENRWEFAPTPPLSTYLFVVVAGPLHTIRAVHRGTPFSLHCRQSLARDLDAESAEILAITRACFDRYADIFDEPYPFDSYDQAFVPELNWGAMESPGCITLRDDFVYRSAVTEAQRQERAMVIAHEMAHMWFGDMVTMRWWDDLWLSESFAEYMGFQVLSQATRFTDTWTAFAMDTKTWGYDADQRPSTHPVAPEAADVTDTETALANFDGVSYAKGASALRQLVAWLGEDAFLDGINDFLGRHRFGVATLADLLQALSAASGLDVSAWADVWLRTTGVDTLRVVRADVVTPGGQPVGGQPVGGQPDGGQHVGGVHVGGVHVEYPGLRSHRVALGLYDRDAEEPSRLVLRGRTFLTLPEGGTSTSMDRDDRQPWPDLVLLNDGDLTYAKVRLDDSSMAALLDGLSTIADPLGRAVAWTGVRDLVRDGELSSEQYLSLVSRQLPLEDDTSIVQGVLGFARRHVIDRYLDPSRRATALSTIGRTCRAIVERTDQQTDAGLRLAAVRGLIDAALTLGDIDDLRDWLARAAVPGGPVLDADLRWRILLRLSILGVAEPSEIEAELARDLSGGGPEGAARCRAGLPMRASKDAAWEAMFGARAEAEALSTYLVHATAQAFWQPEQQTLLAPFVPRYFPAAVEVAARRGASIAAAIGAAGFPFHLVDETTLRAGEQCLLDGAAPASLGRELADQLDDLRRALRVRSLHA